MTKLVIDGTLFSQAHLYRDHRNGVIRVAEGITHEFFKHAPCDVCFANPVYLPRFHHALAAYIRDHFPSWEDRIVSSEPLPFFMPMGYKSLWFKYPGLMFLPVKVNLSDTNAIYHSFYNPIPPSVLKRRIVKSITFHDIIPLKFKGYPAYLQQFTERIVRSIAGNYAISISEFSRNDLLNYNKDILPENVFVAPNAAAADIFYPCTSGEKWSAVQTKYGLPGKNYFLCLAAADPRKNILHIVKSFESFILQEKADAFLFLVGKKSFVNQLLLHNNISTEVVKKIIIPDSFIDNADMASIYSNAIAFVYMSEYEGFGLPPLEAMQCGTPTISANATAIPEVVDDAGILLGIKDQDALAAAYAKLYTDSQLRTHYSHAGIKRAAEFSWEKSAEIYTAIFNTIANRCYPGSTV